MVERPHDPNKKYPAPFSIRLTKQEREELESLADGRPLGQVMKDAALFYGDKLPSSRKLSPEDQKLLAQLLGTLGQSRLSSNINQLAKAANSGSLPVNEDVVKRLNESASTILWMRNNLIQALKIKPQGGDKEIADDP